MKFNTIFTLVPLQYPLEETFAEMKALVAEGKVRTLVAGEQ